MQLTSVGNADHLETRHLRIVAKGISSSCLSQVCDRHAVSKEQDPTFLLPKCIMFSQSECKREITRGIYTIQLLYLSFYFSIRTGTGFRICSNWYNLGKSLNPFGSLSSSVEQLIILLDIPILHCKQTMLLVRGYIPKRN